MHAVFILFNFNQNTSCIFNLYTNKSKISGLEKYRFHPGLIFFTHAATATQLISVEATIVRARVVSKTLALKYP